MKSSDLSQLLCIVEILYTKKSEQKTEKTPNQLVWRSVILNKFKFRENTNYHLACLAPTTECYWVFITPTIYDAKNNTKANVVGIKWNRNEKMKRKKIKRRCKDSTLNLHLKLIT